MMPPDEALIVERSRRFLHQRDKLHRDRRFLAWFGGIGFVVMATALVFGLYPKLQVSPAPDALAEGLAYGFVAALAVVSFALGAGGLIMHSLRAKQDGDYARHALLVKYHDLLIATPSSPTDSAPQNP